MSEGSPPIVMAGSNNPNGSQRRRSPRLSSPPPSSFPSGKKMALNGVAVKRITMRKITARKTTAPSDSNKENTPRRSEGVQQKKVSTPAPSPGRGLPSAGKQVKKKQAPMLSPILPADPCSPPRESPPERPAVDPEDAVWSQKVRRSYSRLDRSLGSPDNGDALFGFGKLQTPEVSRRGELSKTALEGSASLSGLGSFTSLLEAAEDGCPAAELDTNIPGVAVEKKRRRRRRKEVQQEDPDLEALADRMNAEFEEAECYELTVE